MAQGLIGWAYSVYFNKHLVINSRPEKTSLFAHVRSRFNGPLVANIVNRSAVIYPIIFVNHFVFGWIGYPLFSYLFSFILDLQPAKHSWLAVFRLSILANCMIVTILLNLLADLIQILIDFYFGNGFKTSTLAAESEYCLAVGVTRSTHPFIQLQAIQEFVDIVKRNLAKRASLYSAIQDELSVSKELCRWFVDELTAVKLKAQADSEDLIDFDEGKTWLK